MSTLLEGSKGAQTGGKINEKMGKSRHNTISLEKLKDGYGETNLAGKHMGVAEGGGKPLSKQDQVGRGAPTEEA